MSTKTYEFLTLDHTKNVLNNVEQGENFGFKFALKRASVNILHARTVYSILEFLGDIGGLNDAMAIISLPLLTLWNPNLLSASILNRSFTYLSRGNNSGGGDDNP